ncbi:FAD:protein FMN transferase [bacterium]|nr:FAD:protein FMN transferase [bacterium]
MEKKEFFTRNLIGIITALLVVFLIVFVKGYFFRGRIGLVRETRLAMGTYISIATYYHNDAYLKKVMGGAFKRVEDIENAMSIYKEDSEISVLNKSKKPGTYKVSDDLWYVLTAADKVYLESEGAFDITVKPLLELWQKAADNNKLPDKSQVAKVLHKIGWKKVVLHPKTHEIEYLDDNVEITLSALAKGYAVDAVVDVFKKAGIDNCIVDAGGDLYCYGQPKKRKYWHVGVRDPLNKQRVIKILYINDKSVVTSGNYERFYTIEGKSYPQIFSPETGYPVTVNISVSVIADKAVDADAWATALMVIDQEKGCGIIENFTGMEALIIATKHGRLRIRKTSGFTSYETK